MKITFNIEALEILETLGYSYFCNKEVLPPDPDPNEGLCAYWEIIPFKKEAVALMTYHELQKLNINNHFWADKEYLYEMANGMFGLIFFINSDHVFS